MWLKISQPCWYSVQQHNLDCDIVVILLYDIEVFTNAIYYQEIMFSLFYSANTNPSATGGTNRDS